MPRHVQAASTERALVLEGRTLAPGEETVLSDADWAKETVQAAVTAGHLVDLGASTDPAPHPGSVEDRVEELEQEGDLPREGTSLASPTTGDAGKFVAVKEDETGYELVDAPSGGGAGPVTMAVYAANTTFQHDLDATPTGTPGTGNVTVNADGVYTAILHAELYGSGITGGYVLLTAHLSGQTLSVDAEGAPDPGDGEYDTTLTLGPIPMSADDNFSVQISQHGGTPDGNARLIVTKTG
jgi:hypothetical protein